MGWMDGFPFTSREDRERKEQEFQQRVLPLGEEQKQAALGVMHELVGTAPGTEELLFSYISAKDALALFGTEEKGQFKALRAIPPSLRIGEEGRRLIIALALLDLDTRDIEDFPTAQAVRVKTAELLV